MAELRKAKNPFRFYSRLHLTELTGYKAVNIMQLLALIKKVPGSSIYHHTHRFLQQHLYLSPEPPNDFAYWVREFLSEDELGERLACIDTLEFTTIRDLREKIIEVIETYLEDKPQVKLKFANAGEEFHFVKSVSFIFPTSYVASDLKEFVEILKKITIDSIYFHIFEARLRLEKGENDFSYWIATSLENKKLAEEISQLDPYTRTLDELRKTLIRIIEKHI
ncbi:MAG: DUF5752 family protein [Candidatus Omnitrophota bacterium]